MASRPPGKRPPYAGISILQDLTVRQRQPPWRPRHHRRLVPNPGRVVGTPAVSIKQGSGPCLTLQVVSRS